MSLPNDADTCQETSQKLATGLIVHATKGRLRVRVPRLGWDATYTSKLEQQIQSLSFVTNVVVNSAASCLTINYDVLMFPTDSVPPIDLLDAIEQVSNLKLNDKKDTLVDLSSNNNDIEGILFNPQAAQAHLNRVGGELIGAAAGDVVGGAVGATAGAMVMGPAGAVLGGQIGVFVGGVIGTQVGAETVYHVEEQLARTASTEKAGLTPQHVTQIRQKGAAEKIGETVGQVFGGILGRIVMGPTGQIVGSVAGRAIVGQLGEDTASTTNTPQSQPKQEKLENTPQ
ncbi:hypothetical protein NIES4071_07970 [Calothrix sp. NIES-4071]|nr:hypothetical protein NIES4071_07970 [Calothrix sp. NIES-4071]BAZ55139.1 hypothetical protein NIES4105_07930 [Calothrix sp. NIES-4105]